MKFLLNAPELHHPCLSRPGSIATKSWRMIEEAVVDCQLLLIAFRWTISMNTNIRNVEDRHHRSCHRGEEWALQTQFMHTIRFNLPDHNLKPFNNNRSSNSSSNNNTSSMDSVPPVRIFNTYKLMCCPTGKLFMLTPHLRSSSMEVRHPSGTKLRLHLLNNIKSSSKFQLVLGRMGNNTFLWYQFKSGHPCLVLDLVAHSPTIRRIVNQITALHTL
mmetsp:Transcript_118984/g.344142  ORF Transcript_118984/g.344142 Transcript_118984/m.344142 type:complete len:216 (-) Transcript_118984:2731-3378(-)